MSPETGQETFPKTQIVSEVLGRQCFKHQSRTVLSSVLSIFKGHLSGGQKCKLNIWFLNMDANS